LTHAAHRLAGKQATAALALDTLQSLHKLKLEYNAHVFAGNTQGKPLSNMAMTTLLKRMGRIL
jgi:hypothetical protein